MPRTSARPLWTCPKCGAKFVNPKQWHSCGRATLAEWKRRMTPAARAIYDRFESLVAACGEYHVSPAKTRITFLARVRFCGITSIRGERVEVGFALPARLTSPRLGRIREEVPGWWSHHLVVTDPAQLDDQVAGWIRRSYRLMGMQERLKSRQR